MRHSWALVLAAAASPLVAQSAIEPVLPDASRTAQGDVAVTIYNNDTALVQDCRNLSLPVGRTVQDFPDVSAQIRPETVTLSGNGIGIIEQNFDFDLLTPAAMMQKAVGQTVTPVRVNPATGLEVRERARVLAANSGVVMQIGDRIEVLRDDGLPTRVIFDRVPAQLRARPTCSPAPEPEYDSADSDDAIVVTGSRMMAEREDFGDLKLYRIPIPVTVASNSQKQVALLEQPRARLESFYRWSSWIENSTDEPTAADRILKLENREKDGLVLPLPAGRFTLFTDRAGEPFLLGEGRMTDRAVGETVEVTLNEYPGVGVEQQEVDRDDDDRETELIVTNDQQQAVRFQARFNGENRVSLSSEKLVRRDGYWWWIINIPPNGIRRLRAQYRDE